MCCDLSQVLVARGFGALRIKGLSRKLIETILNNGAYNVFGGVALVGVPTSGGRARSISCGFFLWLTN